MNVRNYRAICEKKSAQLLTRLERYHTACDIIEIDEPDKKRTYLASVATLFYPARPYDILVEDVDWRAANEATRKSQIERNNKLDVLIENLKELIRARGGAEALSEFESSPVIGVRVSEPSIKLIKDVVCEHYGVDLIELEGHRRNKSWVWPRQVAMYLSFAMTTRSMPEIGMYIGGRDHTTIMHGHKKVSRLMKEDPDVLAEVTKVRERVEEEKIYVQKNRERLS